MVSLLCLLFVLCPMPPHPHVPAYNGQPHMNLTRVPATVALAARECDPAETGGYCVTGGCYKCGDQGKMIRDIEQEKWLFDYEARKDALVWAMRTRCLTDAEMGEVRQLGTNLLTRTFQTYYQPDLDKEFDELMLQQFRFRVIGCGTQKETK